MDNPQPQQPQPRPSGGRSALWALLGVLLGFTLPTLACMGFFFMFIIGLSSAGGQAAPAIPVPIQVSGPLTGPAIALIEVNGTIVTGSSDAFTTGIAAAEDIIAQIEYANQDPDVKAILLKVNSPGGSVVASDLIYNELILTEKPIVVLMDEIAASGGYYISMAADHIIANPNSLVGSIGVISTIPNAQELLDELGIQFNVFVSGDNKDFGSLYREMTDEEKAYWQSVIDETYEGFLAIVIEGRGLPEEDARALADGRVYTGKMALEYGLIDDLGYEDDAIREAAQLGLISGTPRIVRFSSDTSLISLLGGSSLINNSPIPQDLLRRLLAPSLEFRWLP